MTLQIIFFLSSFLNQVSLYYGIPKMVFCGPATSKLFFPFVPNALHLSSLFLFSCITSATICLLQKNNKGDKNTTVPTSFWNIFDWPSPCSLLPSPSPVQPLQGIFSTALTVTTCYQKIRVVLPFSPLCIFPSLTLSCLYHYLGLLLTEHNPPNPVKSILTGYFSAISEG